MLPQAIGRLIKLLNRKDFLPGGVWSARCCQNSQERFLRKM